MRVQKTIYLDSSIESEKLILRELDSNTSNTQRVLRELLFLGVLAKRSGFHIGESRLAILPNSPGSILKAHKEEPDATLEPLTDEPKLRSQSLEVLDISLKREAVTQSHRNESTPRADPKVIGNLRSLVAGNSL